MIRRGSACLGIEAAWNHGVGPGSGKPRRQTNKTNNKNNRLKNKSPPKHENQEFNEFLVFLVGPFWIVGWGCGGFGAGVGELLVVVELSNVAGFWPQGQNLPRSTVTQKPTIPQPPPQNLHTPNQEFRKAQPRIPIVRNA
jgi:hypothetical protein